MVVPTSPGANHYGDPAGADAEPAGCVLQGLQWAGLVSGTDGALGSGDGLDMELSDGGVYAAFLLHRARHADINSQAMGRHAQARTTQKSGIHSSLKCLDMASKLRIVALEAPKLKCVGSGKGPGHWC